MKLIFIRVYENDKLLFVKQYPSSSHILIGSDPGSQLQLDAPDVSPAHSMIEPREDGFYISDLGAENGVFVNDEKIVEQKLNYGDNLQIGSFRLEFFDTIPKPVSTSQETKKPEAKPETKKPAVSEPAAVTNEKKTEVKKPEKPSSKPKKTEKVKIKMPAQKHFKSPSEPPPPPPPQAKKTSAKDKIDNLKTEELEDVENVEGTEILDDTESTQIVSKAKPPPKPPKIQNIPPPSVPASIPDSKPPSSKQTLSEGDQINVDEIKPSKGSVVQVLTAWGNRIIDSTNFEKSSVTIGSDPSSDIVLPFARGVNHKLLKISSGGAQVIVPNGARGSVVTKTQKLSLEQAAQMGKAGSVSNGTRVSLNQEELVKVDLTERVSLLVRFVPPTIRPMMLPFTGLSAKELTNVIATVGLSIVMAFFFVISEQSELVAKEKDQEEKKQRKALFVYNPPPKPKTKLNLHHLRHLRQ